MLVLPDSLAQEFAKATNDKVTKENKGTYLYGTVRVSGASIEVLFDGADIYTPCTTTVEVQTDDRVMVLVKDRSAVITSNLTTPSIHYKIGPLDINKDSIAWMDVVNGTTYKAGIYAVQENDLESLFLGIVIGDEVISSLNYNGKLYSKNAEITGTIHATAGEFSGELKAATGTFAGELSAATGSFSGTLSAAKGTFAGDLSAAKGTFAGTLSAVDGTFKGNLEAAGGTFKGNLSAAGGTFAGELSAATGTFAGSLSAATGTFQGKLEAATGTFKGSLSAATGSFSGTLSAATGTFKGSLSGATITGATGTFSGTIKSQNVIAQKKFYMENTSVSSSLLETLSYTYDPSNTSSSCLYVGKSFANIRLGSASTPNQNVYLESRTGAIVLKPSTSGVVVSDIRLKKNIRPSTVDALASLNKVELRQYDWKEDNKHQKIGLIADELEQIDSDFTNGGGCDSTGLYNLKTINTGVILAYIVKAIQQLSEKIDNLERRSEIG